MATAKKSKTKSFYKDRGHVNTAWEKFRDSIELSPGRNIVFEATGTGRNWRRIFLRLKKILGDRLVLVRVQAPEQILFSRLERRNKQYAPIPARVFGVLSKGTVQRIASELKQSEFEPDFVISNIGGKNNLVRQVNELVTK